MKNSLKLGKGRETFRVTKYYNSSYCRSLFYCRFGSRVVLTYCLGLAALTPYLTYTLFASSLASLCLGLGLTGGLLAPCWPAVTASVASWFPDQQLNSVFGFVNTATFAGGLVGTGLASALLQTSGWRSVGLPPSLLSLAVSLLVSLLLASPAERGLAVPGKTAGSQQAKHGESKESLMSLARIPCVLELSAAMFSLKFVRYCMALWLPLYLLEALGYDKLQAGMFSTVFDIGGIIGAPVLGLALDRFAAEKPLLGVTVLMVVGTLVTALFALTASWGVIANSIFLLVAGAANSGPDSILAGSVRSGDISFLGNITSLHSLNSTSKLFLFSHSATVN